MATKRYSLSIEAELADRFDDFVAEKNYENRSEAIRDLMRKAIAETEIENPETMVIATLSIIFDYGKHLNHKLVHEQHKYLDEIVSISEVHLSEESSLEAIIIRSTAARAMEISSHIIGIRGVVSGKLSLLPDA